MLFNHDGYLYRFLNLASGLILLNLLWLVMSITVFLAPASTFALFTGVRRLVNDKESPSLRSFWNDLRSSPITSYSLILPSWLLILVFCLSIRTAIEQGAVLIAGVVTIAFVFVGMFVVHIVPAVVRYRSAKGALRAVGARGLGAPGASLLAVAVMVVWLAIMATIPLQFIFIAIAVSGSLPALGCWLLSDRMARRP